MYNTICYLISYVSLFLLFYNCFREYFRILKSFSMTECQEKWVLYFRFIDIALLFLSILHYHMPILFISCSVHDNYFLFALKKFLSNPIQFLIEFMLMSFTWWNYFLLSSVTLFPRISLFSLFLLLLLLFYCVRFDSDFQQLIVRLDYLAWKNHNLKFSSLLYIF